MYIKFDEKCGKRYAKQVNKRIVLSNFDDHNLH